MSFESVIDTLEIRNANKISFVGTSSSFIDTTTGRIQTKGFQHNSNVITDISGPHGRGVATLKKYPEIAFESGKFDKNGTTNVYVQAGYTVESSSQYDTSETYAPWKAFNGVIETTNSSYGEWLSGQDTYSGTVNNGAYNATRTIFESTPGEWIGIRMPKKIKLSKASVSSRWDSSSPRSVREYKLWASDNASDWYELATGTSTLSATSSPNTFDINVSTNDYYSMFRLQILSMNDNEGEVGVGEFQLYGYEDLATQGDHSVDTTFKSRFNNPQLTGVQVLVDGATGVGTNQISGGPDPSGNQSTYVTDGKYWTLNGTLTSNLSVEANTFLEGDQPHAVSVWFNSSNLEANVSNTCVFSIASEEKLDSVNLDLQSNTWHNLTYAYQGEGGSRVTYLDGRKVAEEQAEDTFGDYPPFTMTGYSQGGYVVSSNSEKSGNPAWEAFDSIEYGDANGEGWETDTGTYSTVNDMGAISGETIIDTGGGQHTGHWIKIEFPQRIRIDYTRLQAQNSANQPKSYVHLFSNNDQDWDLGYTHTTGDWAQAGADLRKDVINTTKYYKYAMILVKSIRNTGGTCRLHEIGYYGHRENDLVRLPDPTNVLKYPHIAMSGYAQRGYVVTASNETLADGNRAWHIFDENDSTFWKSDERYISAGVENTSSGLTDTSSTAHGGEYAVLESPNKLKITGFNLTRDGGDTARSPGSIAFLGKNSAPTVTTGWTLIAQQTTSTYTNNIAPLTISGNSNYFKYHAVVIRSIDGNGLRFHIKNIELLGTEEATPVPIQIGGGNIDKVANFRVYDRFIEEDQALEIWNAQKEEFGRAKPQMVLQQGKLGIGTDAPQGSLSVADEPVELEEFPPRGMTSSETYIEGHGVFKASVSEYTGQGAHHDGWNVFAHGAAEIWLVGNNAGYNLSSGEYEDNEFRLSSETSMGQWIKLEMPYLTNVTKFILQPRGPGAEYQAPKSGELWGSKDNYTWTKLHTFTDIQYYPGHTTFNFENSEFYKYYGLVVTKVGGGHASNDYLGMIDLRYFGTREHRQSVLQDGQLTLTKSLNVPRIGPDLDADDTPRRDRLVVEYNTSTNPTFDGAVRDTSGRGNHGVIYGQTHFSEKIYDATEKTLTFGQRDPPDDRIGTGSVLDGIKLQNTNTVSVWVKCNNPTSWEAICIIGEDTSRKHLGLWVRDATSVAVHSDYALSGNGGNYEYEVGDMKQWNHITVVRYGTSFEDHHVYVNGAKVSVSAFTGNTDGGFDLNKKTHLTLGTSARGLYGSATAQNYYLDGSLSNFKLYDTALTAEEVKTLYDMGRTGSVANPQPLHIAAPLYAPGSIVQVQYASTPLNNTSRQTITGGELSDATNDIDYLDMNFKPKFANSSILLTAMINGSATHVTSFGFKEDGTVIRTQSENNNSVGSIATLYEGTTSTNYMVNTNIQVLIPANGVHTRRYNVAGNAYWDDVNYTLYINDRYNDDMRCMSNMVVYEIAN